MSSSNPESGATYWRSLDELAQTPEIQAQIEQEFPGYDPKIILSLSRRRFVKLMAAALGLAGIGLSGCRRWPKEVLAPYVSRPDGHIPGVEEYYASIFELGGIAQGLLVETIDGRPIKVEGNPSHPWSATFKGKLGASNAYQQASVLELYDPSRSRQVLRTDLPASSSRNERFPGWEGFEKQALATLRQALKTKPASVAILSEPSDSPSLASLRDKLTKAHSGVKWYDYEPLNRDHEIEGTRRAFGQALRPRLHLDKAETVVSLDADFLAPLHPASLRYANDWVKQRKSADQGRMNRVYVADTTMSLTGSVADERLPLTPSRVAVIATALARGLGISDAQVPALQANEQTWVDRAVADLKTAGSKAVLIVGASQPAAVHALAHQINARLGAIGNVIEYLPDPQDKRPLQRDQIKELVAKINSGEIQNLLILGGNPVYDAPAELQFADALAKVGLSIHLALFEDDTSAKCTWHLPRAHYLESWGDGRAWDGLVSIQQPMILPLFGGKSSIELLALVLDDETTDGQALVKRTISQMLGATNFEARFKQALHDGLIAGTAVAPVQVQARASETPALAAGDAMSFELNFIPSYALLDGRHAPNGWLLETPDPITKLTWDNAAYINKTDADELNLKDGDRIDISVQGRSIDMPVFVLPGQPRRTLALPLGFGRKLAGAIGSDLGFDVYPLRSNGTSGVGGANVLKLNRRYRLATTQHHHMLDQAGDDAMKTRIGTKGNTGKIVHEASLAEYIDAGLKRKVFVPEGEHSGVELQLYQAPQQFNSPHAWGMTVDMTACIGCNACVVACQAENNVPIVGKENVEAGREMHWLRIDRYFKGQGEASTERAADPNPQLVHMPMFCVHCENAPCEQVCPVAATVHDTEGLNTMVYNRCVGTRYCSNNCPYKVRRFNYFDWHSKDPRGGRFAPPYAGMPDQQQLNQVDAIKQMMFNPEVTVRMRGVMEKCTYCVQRIHAATINARNEHSKGDRETELVHDFEIVTACQQACPTEAIIFGNLNDRQAEVVRQQSSQRSYSVLENLNTRPRTKHMALVRNPAEKSDSTQA